MEPEVGELLDQPLVALGGAGERGLDALLADLARSGGRALRRAGRSTYEPSGRSLARSATRRQSHGAKQESEPVWQTGPAGRTRSRIASPSQSSRSSTTASVLPEVSPLCQSSLARAAPEPRLARSRACGGAPRRPSRRASARGRRRRPARSRASAPSIGHPASSSSRFSSGSRSGRSWTIEATSAASAPASNASARWRASPAPPDAITGTVDGLRDRARQRQVVAGARAVGVDRREQDLAGASLDRLARPRDGVSAARAFRPAWVTTSPPRASIAQTTACEPNSSASAVSSDGSSNAARFTDTLSAPARSSARASLETGRRRRRP